jgi:hypothetical protein
MSRFYRRHLRRVVTIVTLMLASALATTGTALAGPDAWMW